MAEKHPYTSSGGNLTQTIKALRNSFPTIVNADTLKKLGLAPKNESYVINILRFLKVIDSEDNRTDKGQDVFTQHNDETFATQFSELVKSAYKDLFDLHGENTWSLDKNKLITYFRTKDKMSAIIGDRQATTFQVLCSLSGHAKPFEAKKGNIASKAQNNKQKKEKSAQISSSLQDSSQKDGKRELGLTVRIEINLPADGNQETYDRIFKSIKENLLNG